MPDVIATTDAILDFIATQIKYASRQLLRGRLAEVLTQESVGHLELFVWTMFAFQFSHFQMDFFSVQLTEHLVLTYFASQDIQTMSLQQINSLLELHAKKLLKTNIKHL